ncbi:MAG: hypothetical protein WHT84_06135 [Breznakiellaceae bacterium]
MGCPVEYTIVSPIVGASSGVTAAENKLADNYANGPATSLWTSRWNGSNWDLGWGSTKTYTIDVANLAATGHISQSWITKLVLHFTIQDYNWWIQLLDFTYKVGSGAEVSFDLWDANTQGQFNGTKKVSVEIPYGGSGDIVLGAAGATLFGYVVSLDSVDIYFSK